MHSTVELPFAAAAAPRNTQVALFLETLQREQERYLDAIGCARSTLPDQGSQLAQMSAVQGRLVRRLFDAQRAILEQRARVDDEFRAFLTGDVDGARYERQLDALLDEWWQMERRETAAPIDFIADDAIPLSAGALSDGPLIDDPLIDELAEVDASIVVWRAARPLPTSLVNALDTAGHVDLDRLLDDLVADLDAHLAVAAASASVLPPPVAGDLVILGAPEDDDARFTSFWTQPQTGSEFEIDAPEAVEHPLAWIPMQVVVPIAAVTAGLSLALLLIG